MNNIKILDLDNYTDSEEDSEGKDSNHNKCQPRCLPWVEKYRPDRLDDVISQDNIVSVLQKFINNNYLPHLLFYGKPGVGKTSTIVACAKQLYGDQYPYMVLELNASDDRGIEVVRNRIITFSTSKSIFLGKKTAKFKLVILDETDAMTHDAQAILRKVVENCTVNTRFCLICNYIKNINPALRSRCTKFRFSPLKFDDIRSRLKSIACAENINLTESGIKTIIKRSDGDMRKVLNILQSTSMIYDKITRESINNCIGYPQRDQINDILNSLIEDTYLGAYNKILKIKTELGISLSDILIEIHDILVEYILDGNDGNDGNDSNKDGKIHLDRDRIKHILEKIGDIEINLSNSSTENIQLGALVGVFRI